jgi:hypothetical protein
MFGINICIDNSPEACFEDGSLHGLKLESTQMAQCLGVKLASTDGPGAGFKDGSLLVLNISPPLVLRDLPGQKICQWL